MLYKSRAFKCFAILVIELKDKTPQLDKQIIVTTSYCGLKSMSPSSPTSQKKTPSKLMQ